MNNGWPQLPLNDHGDRMRPTTGEHGADIAHQRMDELDVAAVEFALSVRNSGGWAVDLGCGVGLQGLRFAALLIPTLLIDQLPPERTVVGNPAATPCLTSLLPWRYLQKDVRTLRATDLPNDVVLAYSQRFIHYLPLHEALHILRMLHGRMTSGGRLFLSASGLNSELGTHYPHASKPIAD